MKRTPLYLAIAGLTLSAGVTPAFGQEQALEEITVTGSFIKRTDSFDTANPIDIVTDLDIKESGTPNLAEIIRNQPFNYGVDTVSNIIGATGQGGVVSAPNIRGLGEGATLTLLDGRRSASRSIQSLYPQLLLQSVETLTDGGAALYGTDAVGGVVNYIPKKSFEGFEIEAQADFADGDDYGQQSFGFITGGSGDTTNFVFAMQYRNRDPLRFPDRPQYSEGGFSASSDGNPGTFRVPTRDAAGQLTTTFQNLADPGCGLNNQGTGDKSSVGGFSTGFVAFGSCRNEFGANFDYAGEQQTLNSAFIFENHLSDTTTFSMEALYSRNEFANRGTPANPGGRFFELGAIPGDNPGNPYRARDAGGNPLFALTDVNGRYLRDASGVVQLDGTPTIMDSAGEVALNEDVTIVGYRPLGYPTVNGFEGPSYLNSDGSGNLAGTGTTNQYRFVAELEYEFGDSTWSGYTDYVYHRAEAETPVVVQSFSAISAGINGNLIVDGQPAWFNPFSTQWFDCTNRDCTGANLQTDPNQLNTQKVWDQISYVENEYVQTTLNVIDTVATGELFEMPSGVAQAAVGAQWRNEDIEDIQGATPQAGDSWIGGGSPGYKADRNTFSVFGEINLPLMDSDALGVIELSAAARFEKVDDDSQGDLDSDNYKLGFRWAFNDNFVTRFSWGSAFIAPSLPQLFAPETTGLSNVADPLLGAGAAFKSRTLGGNPLLEPETADVWNLGFTLSFDDVLGGDLSWSMDYKYFDFQDRIVRPLPTDLVNDDFAAYLAAGNTAGNAAQIAAWLAPGGGSNPLIERDPISNSLLLVRTPSLNATEMEWKGFDTRLAYRTDTDFGSFRSIINATYVDEYNYQGSEDDPFVNGAGRRNDGTGFVPPAPRIRASWNLGWDYDIHSVSLTGRYTHHILQDGTTCTLNANPGTNVFIQNALGASNGCRTYIPSNTVWDLQYRAELDGILGADSTTAVTLGAINVFDRDAHADASLGGFETQLYDARGQQLYIRLNHTF
ncbi:TonB-dependent receptor [Aurantivibrio infirmus]